MSLSVITVSRLASGKNVIIPPRPNPAPSARASLSASRINALAMASKCSMGTSLMRAKSATHSPCLSARCCRKSSGSTSMERSPRRTPNRRKRLKVSLCRDPFPLLCNSAIALSILRRLEPSGNLRVALPLAALPYRGYPRKGGVIRNAARKRQSYLTPPSFSVNCIFFMATMPQFVPSEVVHDLDFPQREAAFFYGLFLRGYSAEQLRRDIEGPPAVLAKWHREAERDPQLRDIFARMVDYRRHVLAIFDTLVGSDTHTQRVQ